MSESIFRIKLCEDVAEHIIEHIRNQQWTAGMRIPAETELAKYFDVSRSTVRAAIKSLQLAGFLYSRPGSGTYVAENAPLMLATRELAAVMADPENLYALVQARYILEPQLAALAARNAADEEIARLFAILGKMEQKQDRYHLMVCGYQFHETVAELAHNQVLYGFYRSAAKQLQGIRGLESLTLEIFIQGIEEHRLIAQAIAAREESTAKQRMRNHLKKDYAHYLDKTDILE